MNTVDKELLLKDLYARIPYGVKGCCEGETFRTTPLIWYAENTLEYSVNYMVIKNGWRPYLFPLSSMTEEQRQELESLMEVTTIPVWGEVLSPTPEYYDWLNKNYFDYRGLIEKGLAIDATDKNIY